MIGMFAVSEILRCVVAIDKPWEMAQADIGNVFKGMWAADEASTRWQILRGSALGTAIGALPGAGADIAAWMSLCDVQEVSRRSRRSSAPATSKGIIESGAANNSALAGAWIPALVFGIPGDSITAIVIGVLYIKGSIPGPTIFMNNAVAHLRHLHRLHPRQPADDSARRGCHQGREADAAGAARAADAGDPAVLHRRRVRDQQLGLRRGADARLRHGRVT